MIKRNEKVCYSLVLREREVSFGQLTSDCITLGTFVIGIYSR
jgi:hypothetical protein